MPTETLTSSASTTAKFLLLRATAILGPRKATMVESRSPAGRGAEHLQVSHWCDGGDRRCGWGHGPITLVYESLTKINMHDTTRYPAVSGFGGGGVVGFEMRTCLRGSSNPPCPDHIHLFNKVLWKLFSGFLGFSAYGCCGMCSWVSWCLG